MCVLQHTCGVLTQECEMRTVKYKGEHVAVTLDIKEWIFSRRNFIMPIPSGRINTTSSYIIRRTAVRQAPVQR